ncbi:COX2 oxidase, partial [Acromyrmex heyeri]
TSTPIFILIFIVILSIKILYLTDEIFNNNFNNNPLYSDFLNIDFDSFIITSNQLLLNEFRLLDVDNRCILHHLIVPFLTASIHKCNSCLNSPILRTQPIAIEATNLTNFKK